MLLTKKENLTNPDQTAESVPQIDRGKSLLFFLKERAIKDKRILALLIFFGILILLSIIMAILPKRETSLKSQTPPTPIVTPELTQIPMNPESSLTTNPEILSIVEEIKKIETNLNSGDLGESNLNLPIMDWGAKIQ